MNKLFALVLSMLLVFLPSFSFADTDNLNPWLEGQFINLKNDKDIFQVNGGLSGNVSGSVGYFVFGQAFINGYKQIYAGPTIKPFSWLEVGVGIGRENVGGHRRQAGYFSVSNGRRYIRKRRPRPMAQNNRKLLGDKLSGVRSDGPKTSRIWSTH